VAHTVVLTPEWSLARVMVFRTAGLDARAALAFSGDRPAGFLPEAALAEAAVRAGQDPWLREAVLWQNSKVVGDWSAASGAGRPTRARYRRMALARLLQRYALRNETIGFFGPVAWARFEPGLAGVVAGCGAGDEVARRSHFEPWAMDLLARQWEADPAIRAALPPRLPPAYRLDGRLLSLPSEVELTLTEREADVVCRCDGRATPAAIAAATGTAVDEVIGILDRLTAAGVLRWGLHLPIDQHMDGHLSDALPDVPAARTRRAELDTLRGLRADVDRQAGDPDRTGTALDALHARFRAMTGQSANRTKGTTDGGRGLLWLDSLSDWDVTLGASALADLAAPVDLLLDAARWISWWVAEDLAERARDLLAESPDGTLRADLLFDELRPELTAARAPLLDRVIAALQQRTAALIPLPQHDGRSGAGACVRLRSEDLATSWRRAFAAPGPGWSDARTHSLDVMLAAGSPEQAEHGDRWWVLGELHVANNPIDVRFCAENQRPFVHLDRLLDEITNRPHYLPAFPREWARLTPRTHPVRGVDPPGRHAYWSIWPDDVLPADRARLRALDLRVRIENGRPVAVGPGVRAPFVDLVGAFLSIAVADAFRPFPERPHTPRVCIDRLIVQRERWCLDAANLLRDSTRRVDEAFLAGRMQAAGLPRHFFVRTPAEPKPVFCDLASAPLMKNLRRLLRVAGTSGDQVCIEEMMPGFDQLWLRRRGTEPRTSEFRMLAVDQRGTLQGRQEQQVSRDGRQ
jgi:hypothetical protein